MSPADQTAFHPERRPGPLDGDVADESPRSVEETFFELLLGRGIGLAAVIVNGDGIRVVQPAGKFDLALEAGQSLLVALIDVE